MTIFSKQSKTLSSALKKASTDALTSFHKVMNELKEINATCKAKEQELVIEVEKINSEIGELQQINVDNSKVIANIEKILT